MAKDLAPDWILQQALSAQSTAHHAFVRSKPELRAQDGGLTLAVLGCGTMGSAILGGVMASLQSKSDHSTASVNAIDVPDRLPSKFNACVKSSSSAQRIRKELGKYDADLIVWENDNLGAVKASDVVILACEPHIVGDVLREEGIRDALAGKLLISVCGGVPEKYVHDVLYKSSPADTKKCAIAIAIPNIAASVRESMTIISTSNPPLSEENSSLVKWIFSRIGRVANIPPSRINTATALCASGPAFCAMMIESMASGAITKGIPRPEAYEMAAQAMKGAAGLVLEGEHPALVRDNVSTPGGCTIAGIQVLEEGSFRGTVSRAIRESSDTVSRLASERQHEE
ncbi:Pyrroline-5-carboxylate reductase [Pseudocercospora fuligena]|uniref:Pyrroline-5-carboxylate reductase n=1 Tax=Pseudocercospora fuligena TaxID=685502 RepID=A0A8H6VDN7_9PEZI|nr:Pyrroline-5-carboxylate reductase [Pseudocercospora fuligena]